MTSYYKEAHNEYIRKKEAEKIIKKYVTRVPIILERSNNCNDNTPYLDKRKFIVPKMITLSSFLFFIRKRMKLEKELGLFFLVDDAYLPINSQLIVEIYNEYKHDDGFLYIKYSGENTFG